MNAPDVDIHLVLELKKRLQRFLEIHTTSKIQSPDDGALTMLVRYSRTQNTKIKDKMINYKLGELEKRLLLPKLPAYKDYIICEFLIDELEKYVRSKL